MVTPNLTKERETGPGYWSKEETNGIRAGGSGPGG